MSSATYVKGRRRGLRVVSVLLSCHEDTASTEEGRRAIGKSAPHRAVPQAAVGPSHALAISRLGDAIEGLMEIRWKSVQASHSLAFPQAQAKHIYSRENEQEDHRTATDHVRSRPKQGEVSDCPEYSRLEAKRDVAGNRRESHLTLGGAIAGNWVYAVQPDTINGSR